MVEENEETGKDDHGSTGLIRFINSLHEIKLPELVKKNVLTATGRLIMGAVDIPVAWMESKAKQIRSESDALSKVTEASGTTTVQAFRIDTELQARSIDHWGSKLLKKQLNREEVYWQAMKNIEDNPPKKDSLGEIDEDWLEQFGNLAESKSNKNIKLILSKILEGEIRNAGSYSPRTLEAIKLLDTGTARVFLYLLSMSLVNNGIPLPLSRIVHSHYNSYWAKNYDITPSLAIQKLREFGLLTKNKEQINPENLLKKQRIQVGSFTFKIELTRDVERRLRTRYFTDHELGRFVRQGIGVYHFTTIGLEISQAVSPIIDEDILHDIDRSLKSIFSPSLRKEFQVD